METKTCYACKEAKPLDAFYKNSGINATTLRGQCKACYQAKRPKRVPKVKVPKVEVPKVEVPKVEVPKVVTKTCSACKEAKPLEAFYKNSGNATTLRAQCKACHHAKRPAYVPKIKIPKLPVTSKVCSVCKVDKDIDNFRKVHKETERRHAECADCRNAGSRKKMGSVENVGAA